MTTLVYLAVSLTVEKIFYDRFDTRTVVGEIFKAVLFSAFLFTVGDRLMKKWAQKIVKSIPDPELNGDEKLILKAGANLFRGIEAVGGVLALTEKRLIFKPHKFNIQNRPQEFSLREVEAVRPHKRFSKVFCLEFRDNKTNKFVVESPAEWIDTISQLKNSLRAG